MDIIQTAKELRKKGVRYWLITEDDEKITVKTDGKDIVIRKNE